ncbi:MAG: type III secretion system chaperone [Ramlibacter sp.]
MTADDLLNDLGLTAGLPEFRFDAKGCARLMFDDKVAVNFENDESARCIHLYSPVAPLPTERHEALYKSLLQANLFGSETLGATLAIDDLQDEIVMCRCVPTQDTTGKAFAEVLERFVTAVEEWTQKLGSAAFQEPVDISARPVQLPPSMAFLRV